jgi:sporulation protein YlmC with PRC-barrel domain
MTSHWLFTSAVVLALATPSWAQTTTNQPATAPPPQTIIPEQAQTTVLAKDLMGANVFGPDDKKVGTVEDLILDEQQKITGVVVGVGGFLGVGKKEVGLNWQQAKVVENPDTTAKIVINLTKADLEAAPDFKTKAERQAEEQAAAQQQQLQQQQQPLAPPPQPSQ